MDIPKEFVLFLIMGSSRYLFIFDREEWPRILEHMLKIARDPKRGLSLRDVEVLQRAMTSRLKAPREPFVKVLSFLSAQRLHCKAA